MSYHDKKGRFCKADRAHTKSSGGQRYRVVRSHRRIGPDGKEIRARKSGNNDVVRLVASVESAKSRSDHLVSSLDGGLISIARLMGEGAKRSPRVSDVEEWWDYMDPGSVKSVARKARVPLKRSSWNAAHWERVMDYYTRVFLGDPRGFSRGRNV